MPNAPTGLAATKASGSTATDGKISGVTDAMEYQKNGDTTWTAVGENQTEITGLTAGTYKVRYAGTADKDASPAVTIQVGVKEDQTAPTGLTATKATSNTATDGKISGVTAAMEYQIDGATTWTAVGENKTEITGLTAGTYRVRYAETADKNASPAATVQVGVKAEATVTKAPAAKTLTYSGQAQELVTAGEASGGTMQYALGTKDAATGTYSASIPTGTEAGTYYVWYKVTGDDNHKDTKALSVTSSILPVDRDNLNKLIGEAEDYLETIQEKYPDIAKDLEAAINEANGIAENPNVKAEEIAEQIRKLTEALEKAKKAVKDAEDQAAAKAVKDLIDVLPDADKVTIDDKEAIEAARKAYNALTEDQKKLISAETLKHLTDDEEALANLDVKAVISQINALPDADKVTTNDKEAIEAARKAYDALTAEKKQLVPAEVLKKLTDDEAALAAAEVSEADRAAANAVVKMINALPDADKVTINDKEAIEAARKAYDALTDAQKKLVPADVLKKLTDDEAALAAAEASEADRAAADAVVKMINALPDADKVTINDKTAIEAARKAYDALTDAQKKLIPADVLKKLTDDEAALAAAKASEADRAAADAVVKMINALPYADKVTVADKEAIEAARKAYEALTDAQKKLVPADVLKKLTDDEAALAAAEASEADRAAADAVVKMINALPDADKVTINDKEAIEAARKAYDALTDAQKKLIPADVLKKLTDDEAALKGKSISYTTYEGEGGEYKHGSDGTLTFVFKRSENDSETFARFTGLKYDGRSLTRDKDYTAKAGSVIITLDHELLESMMVGNHILTAVFDDGEADAHFTVIANAEPTATPTATPTPTPTPKPVPKTGDNSNPALWLAMMILGILCIGGVVFRTVRKRG